MRDFLHNRSIQSLNLYDNFLFSKVMSDMNEMLEFLNYIEHSTQDVADASRGELVRDVHRRVTEVKNNKSLEVEYMTLYEKFREIREDGLEEGREEGREEGLRTGRSTATSIIKLHLKGLSGEQIAETLGIPLDEVELVISDLESA